MWGMVWVGERRDATSTLLPWDVRPRGEARCLGGTQKRRYDYARGRAGRSMELCARGSLACELSLTTYLTLYCGIFVILHLGPQEPCSTSIHVNPRLRRGCETQIRETRRSRNLTLPNSCQHKKAPILPSRTSQEPIDLPTRPVADLIAHRPVSPHRRTPPWLE